MAAAVSAYLFTDAAPKMPLVIEVEELVYIEKKKGKFKPFKIIVHEVT